MYEVSGQLTVIWITIRWFAKFRERLAVNKQSVQNFDKERFNLSKLNELVVKNIIRLRLQTGLQLWRT